MITHPVFQGTEHWMRSNLDLPDSFYSILHENAGSTRLEHDGGALVAVIHDILFDFSFDPADVSPSSFLLDHICWSVCV